MSKFLSTLLHWTCAGGGRARLPVLLYHRVLQQPDPLQPGLPCAAEVETQFRHLAALFRVLPLDEAVERLQDGRLPPAALCITFDDGYRDNFELALPLLARYRLPATFFVSTAFLGDGLMFNDVIAEAIRRMPAGTLDLGHWGVGALPVGDLASRRSAIDAVTAAVKHATLDRRQQICDEVARRADAPLPADLMMTAEQLRTLAHSGMTVGGHTVNHPILEVTGDDEAWREIVDNRDAIHAITGTAPRAFAYPNGKPQRDYAERHVAMVRKAGYAAAVSTRYGIAAAATDRWQIPRFVLSETSPAGIVRRALLMRRNVVSHRPA